MKYLLLIVVVVFVLWLLRPRRRVGADSASRRRTGGQAEHMVVCEHCGVHLPQSDALPGRGGVFCGEAHRAAHEAARRR